MKLNSIIFCLCAGLCSSAVVGSAFSMDKEQPNGKGKLNYYTKFLASSFLENETDHQNFVLAANRDNLEKFEFNPIPLSVNNVHLFPYINTVVFKHDANNIGEIMDAVIDMHLNHYVFSESEEHWNDVLEQSNDARDTAKKIIKYLNEEDPRAKDFAKFIQTINANVVSEKELSNIEDDDAIKRRVLDLLNIYYMFTNGKYGNKFKKYVIDEGKDNINRDVYKEFLRDEYFIILQHQRRSFSDYMMGINKANLHNVQYNRDNGQYEVDKFVDCNRTKSIMGLGIEEVPSCEIITRKDVRTLQRHGFNTVDIFNNAIQVVQSIGKHAFFRSAELGDIVIPDSIQSIDDGAFAQCEGIRSITLNEGLEKIGYAAFESLTAESITIPNTVTSIGRAAFFRSELKSIVIPSNIRKISKETFYGCNKLETVVIEPGITRIGYQAFADCKELKAVEIAGSVEVIGINAFANCDKLSSVVIKEGVKSLGNRMFEGCTALTNVSLPQSLTSIDARAFADTGLTEINIPESVQEIGGNAFQGCEKLESVKIPHGVTRIDCFCGCTNLTSVDIPDTVTKLCRNAFRSCHSLESLELPKSIQKVGEYAFANCENLKCINIRCSDGVISQDERARIIGLLRNGELSDTCIVKFVDGNGNEI